MAPSRPKGKSNNINPRIQHLRNRLLPSRATTKAAQSIRFLLNIFFSPVNWFLRVTYIYLQFLITLVFQPKPPPKQIKRPYARIAVIGAGLTGVSSAAHAVSHGFEVVIYEANDRPGGIWARENKTSGLQLNSIAYRFHPSVIWKKAFPQRDEILDQIGKIWKEYRLEERTRLNTPVTKVERKPRPCPPQSDDDTNVSPSQWIINNGEDGPFDAIIVTIGTCGEPNWVQFEGLPENLGQKGTQQTQNDDAQSQSQDQPEDEEHRVGEDYPHGKNVSSSQINNERKKRRKHRKKARAAREAGEEPAPEDAEFELSDHDDEGGSDDQDEDDNAKTTGSPTAETHSSSEKKSKGSFKGPVLHSCELDNATEDMIKGKTVIVVGSGASGVEAVETVLERGPEHVIMLARTDKWIIPRNIIFDTALAAQPFGRNMPLSFIWEWFLTLWQYHGVEELVPDKGIFTDTPVVNDVFLDHVRAGRCSYVRCETERFTTRGAMVKVYDRIDRRQNSRGSHSSDTNTEESHEEVIQADVVVLATGYKKPSMDFLPKELFPEGYDRPNLYLQNFSTEDWSCLMTNSAYMNAIGTVGHAHIGIYTRVLLTLLLDPAARPLQKDMKLWVDVIRYIKRGASGGALSFFTYAELTIWLILFHIIRPDRIRWLFFIWPGWGVRPDDESLYPCKRRMKA